MYSNAKEARPRKVVAHEPIVYVLNAFSLNMLGEEVTSVNIRKDAVIESDRFLLGKGNDQRWWGLGRASDFIAAIGHEDTARLVQKLYGIEPNLYNRETVTLRPGDLALVFQYFGPRLPEGATELPQGAKIVPVVVEVVGPEVTDIAVY